MDLNSNKSPKSTLIHSFIEINKAFFSIRQLITILMGFAAGLPLLLTGSVLTFWLRQEGLDLTIIGFLSLVGLPYTLKFLWAPLLDRFSIPGLGRRRGWLLLSQLTLALGLLALSNLSPSQNLELLALVAMLIAFASATQDSVIDAYRREHLPDNELALGASVYVSGYRIGLLVAGGGGLLLVDQIGFAGVYMVAAGILCLLAVVTLLVPEPQIQSQPTSIKDAIAGPVRAILQQKLKVILGIFGIILLYKLGDSMASVMTSPLYVDLGYSPTEVGTIAKGIGFAAVILGGLTGGALLVRMTMLSAMFWFGILQMISTAGFAVLNLIGHDLLALSIVIAFENFASGLGTAALLGYMARLTDTRFTATQYAILTSISGIPRVVLGASTGVLAEKLGWTGFFLFCTIIAIPGLVIIRFLQPPVKISTTSST